MYQNLFSFNTLIFSKTKRDKSSEEQCDNQLIINHLLRDVLFEEQLTLQRTTCSKKRNRNFMLKV